MILGWQGGAEPGRSGRVGSLIDFLQLIVSTLRAQPLLLLLKLTANALLLPLLLLLLLY